MEKKKSRDSGKKEEKKESKMPKIAEKKQRKRTEEEGTGSQTLTTGTIFTSMCCGLIQLLNFLQF